MSATGQLASTGATSIDSSAGGSQAGGSSSRAKRALDRADDSKEQPADKRHCHAGSPNSPAKKPSFLYRDVLQSGFAFLDRKDFALLTQISKEWFRVAAKMPPQRWSFECSTEATLYGLLVSPLRRHVGCLQYRSIGRVSDSNPALLSATQLLTISDRMARLEELECRIELTHGMPPLHWPAKLTKLTLTLQLATNVSDEVAALMSLVGRSLARHAPLVDSFVVRCVTKSGHYHPISGELLSPLLHWPLKTFTFHGPLSPSAYPILRRMACLTQVGLLFQEQFVGLVSLDGPVPPLEGYVLSPPRLRVTAEVVPLLVKLPTLRRLEVEFVLADPTPLVPLFRQLHTLAVVRQSTCDLGRFVSTLVQATQLTDLSVTDHHQEENEAHLTAILAPMRQLKTLRVHSHGVRSLAFLSRTAHLAATLTDLDLTCCELEPVELCHLRPLHALERLDLFRCFTSPLDSHTVSTMTPGAVGFLKEFWPNLRRFVWIPK